MSVYPVLNLKSAMLLVLSAANFGNFVETAKLLSSKLLDI